MSARLRYHGGLHAVPHVDVPSDVSGAEADAAWGRSFEAATDFAPLIPEGEYQARVAAPPQVSRLFQSQRLVLTFEVVLSQYAGTLLEFYAEVRTGKHARFREAWEVANGGPVRRRDRMPLSVFRNRLFLVRVRTVTKDRLQRKRARPYSVVDSIVERLA